MRGWITRTFTGRALLFGTVVKLTAFVVRLVIGRSSVIEAIDTVGDLALIAGAFALGSRLFVDVRRRLLWRVRRKLTLSYIFIGVVPALLIITFFVLVGLMLLVSVSSYVLRTRFEGLVDRTRSIAEAAALEVRHAPTGAAAPAALLRYEADSEKRDGPASYALVPASRSCGTDPRPSARVAGITAGPWSHAPAPDSLPDWVTCDGFAGLVVYTSDGRTGVAARAVSWPGGTHALIVDVPFTNAIARVVRRDVGITVGNMTPLDAFDRSPSTAPAERPTTISIGPAEIPIGSAPDDGQALEWVAFLDYADWLSGQAKTLTVSFRMPIWTVFQRISGPTFGIGSLSYAQVLVIAVTVVGGLFLVIQAVALVMGLSLARSITGSIHALFAGTERVRRGDFTHKIAIRSRDQLGELAESFNSMTSSIEDLLQQKAEKERLEQELRIARSIQMSLLPSGPMVFPGISLIAHCEPAREVGGDYYDFLPIDDHTLGLLVADVSGKGTSAALYMAALKGIVLSLSQQHTSPRQLLIDANRILARHLDARSFITVTYAIVDMRSRTLRYARAGHCPMIYSPGPYAASRTPQVLMPDGLVLGLQIDDTQLFPRLLVEVELPLGTGDVFVLYTDGITEAMNADGDCFGDARLADIIGAHADVPSEQLRECILEEVRAFAGPAPQHDDMTMVLLRILDS